MHGKASDLSCMYMDACRYLYLMRGCQQVQSSQHRCAWKLHLLQAYCRFLHALMTAYIRAAQCAQTPRCMILLF
jgi:hypothetical protein